MILIMRENTPLLVSGVVAAGDIMFWFMLINARHNFISLQRTFHGWLAPVGRLAAHCARADQFPSRKTEKLCGDDCGPRKSAPAGVLAGGARRRDAANSAQECMTSWRHVAAEERCVKYCLDFSDFTVHIGQFTI